MDAAVLHTPRSQIVFNVRKIVHWDAASLCIVFHHNDFLCAIELRPPSKLFARKIKIALTRDGFSCKTRIPYNTSLNTLERKGHI